MRQPTTDDTLSREVLATGGRETIQPGESATIPRERSTDDVAATNAVLDRTADRTATWQSLPFTAYPSVQRYAASLDDLVEAERGRRLAILEEFCRFVDRSPDLMVEELYDPVARKYRRRGFYMERVRAFADLVGGPEYTRLFRGNVIRSFFIANGYRLIPERPSWME